MGDREEGKKVYGSLMCPLRSHTPFNVPSLTRGMSGRAGHKTQCPLNGHPHLCPSLAVHNSLLLTMIPFHIGILRYGLDCALTSEKGGYGGTSHSSELSTEGQAHPLKGFTLSGAGAGGVFKELPASQLQLWISSRVVLPSGDPRKCLGTSMFVTLWVFLALSG